jgi:hypothetical protein
MSNQSTPQQKLSHVVYLYDFQVVTVTFVPRGILSVKKTDTLYMID